MPVVGLPCSQKKRKLALSISLRNLSSSGDNPEGRAAWGEGAIGPPAFETGAGVGDWPYKPGTIPASGRLSPVRKRRRSTCRRESRFHVASVMRISCIVHLYSSSLCSFWSNHEKSLHHRNENNNSIRYDINLRMQPGCQSLLFLAETFPGRLSSHRCNRISP